MLSLFKQKLKLESEHMMQLLRYFAIPIPKQNGITLDFAELKKPDFLFTVNLKLMQKLYRVLNQENGQAKPE